MADRLPPLHSLRAFEAFARLRNVTLAADDLCVTHSAVIHQLKQLQDWMGVELVRRGSNGLLLTEAGERFRVPVCEGFQRIMAETRLMRGGSRRGAVRVSAMPMFAVAWLIPRLPGFWALHPEVDLQVNYTAPQTWDQTVFDMSIRLEDPSLITPAIGVPLVDGVAVPMCSPAYARRVDGLTGSPRAMLKATLIHDEDRSGWTQWLSRAGLPVDHAQSGTLFADGNLTLASVMAGEGVGLLRRALLKEQVRAGALVALNNVVIDEHLHYVLRPNSDRPM